MYDIELLPLQIYNSQFTSLISRFKYKNDYHFSSQIWLSKQNILLFLSLFKQGAIPTWVNFTRNWSQFSKMFHNLCLNYYN